jgi:branched-chain amino acid aminotransferase
MHPPSIVYVNGTLVSSAQASVSVFDHGLLYGDGVFEGIRAYNGRVFKLERHLERLYASARAIDLTIPLTPSEMEAAVLETCRANDLSEGYIRLVVTRGPGALGVDPRQATGTPGVIIIAVRWPSSYDRVTNAGMSAITSSYRRTPPDSLSPSIKTLNYLNNVMAKIEANQRGADEALLLDHQGYVSEATAENVFVVMRGTLVTPWTSTNLAGITRETVLELAAALGIPAVERPFTHYDVWVADEAFMCGTGAEVIPIVALDERTIGDGRPGPLTNRLMTTYHAHVRTHGTPIQVEVMAAS